MDFDAFVDELEITLDCKNQGYIKCLELVKSLKEENEKLKEQAVKDNGIIEQFEMYCELIDEDPDAWEDLISNSPYYERNEDGELCRLDD